jgi:hypothetical protein
MPDKRELTRAIRTLKHAAEYVARQHQIFALCVRDAAHGFTIEQVNNYWVGFRAYEMLRHRAKSLRYDRRRAYPPMKEQP